MQSKINSSRSDQLGVSLECFNCTNLSRLWTLLFLKKLQKDYYFVHLLPMKKKKHQLRDVSS